MKKWVGRVVLVLGILLAVSWSPPTVSADSGVPIKMGDDVRVIVRYKGGVPLETIRERAFEVSAGGRVIASIPALNAVVLQVPAERLDAVLKSLRGDSNVLYAEVDAVVEAAFTPNDPQYSLHQYGPQIIQANKAWDITEGDPNVLVAVVDTGVDYTHPDLAGKVVLGYDFVNNDADPMDDNGHGTHVAGIIAAATNNGIGVAGVGFNTRVLAVKVLSASGSGFYSTVAQGITYAADHGARIINLSLRGTVSSAILQDAINYAWNKGVLIVAAAGNDGSNAAVYPAAYPHVLAVAATDWNDNHWSLSNYGDYVDLAAPGVGIYSTDWAGGVGPYASRSGTSMAAPHVAAVAALVLSVDPGLSNAQLASLLTSTADDKGDPGWDPYYGAGRVNAYAAVTAAQGSTRDVKSGSIGDYVWLDVNGNGIQDAGEPGMANVRVDLYLADGTLVATTATGPDGHYVFTTVPAGSYFVHVATPTGFVFTRPHQGADDTLDSDVDQATGRTPVFSLAAGQSTTSWDAGFIPTVQVGGVTWVDPNANAVREPEEVHVVPNVPVHITGTDIIGTHVDITVQTDDTGSYAVDNLLPGVYRVEVPMSLDGYVLTSTSPVTVTLTSQQREALSVDFGYIAPTWVSLVNFSNVATPTRVHLEWVVHAQGISLPTFHVWRSTLGGKWTRLTTLPLSPIGDDGRLAYFEYDDLSVVPGTTYVYQLRAADGTAFGPWRVNVPTPAPTAQSTLLFLAYVSR